MARNSQHTKHKCIRGIENNDGQIYHAVNDFALIFLAIFLLHSSFFPPDTFQSKKQMIFRVGKILSCSHSFIVEVHSVAVFNINGL